jgi:hypothetical protein
MHSKTADRQCRVFRKSNQVNKEGLVREGGVCIFKLQNILKQWKGIFRQRETRMIAPQKSLRLSLPVLHRNENTGPFANGNPG